MSRETQKIIELLQYWDQFSQQEGADHLSDFARWLYHHLHQEENSKPKAPKPLYDLYKEEVIPLNSKIGWLWGRLIRFTQLLVKKAFQDHSIKSMEEYGILKYIALRGKPVKIEIANYSLLENTTCFEILKRLLKHGLIQEEIDTGDRRSRRVFLTEDGKKALQTSDQKVTMITSLLVGPLTREEKNKMLSILERLDDFHEQLHQEAKDTSLAILMHQQDADIQNKGS